jgi:hypothetical protein
VLSGALLTVISSVTSTLLTIIEPLTAVTVIIFAGTQFVVNCQTHAVSKDGFIFKEPHTILNAQLAVGTPSFNIEVNAVNAFNHQTVISQVFGLSETLFHNHVLSISVNNTLQVSFITHNTIYDFSDSKNLESSFHRLLVHLLGLLCSIDLDLLEPKGILREKVSLLSL